MRPQADHRLSLHPKGVAPRIENLAEWRAHLVARLRRQVEMTADEVLRNFEMFFPADAATAEAVRRAAG